MASQFGPNAILTPANGVTVARLLATPVFLLVLLALGPSWVVLAIWLLLASTDGIDGWLARRQGATASGAFLDPLADKFLVLGALITLAADGRFGWIPVGLITGREILISVYRSWVARRGVSVPARPLAKAKTAVQILAVAAMLVPAIGLHHPWAARDLLWVAVALALTSGAQYLLDSRYRATGATPAGEMRDATPANEVRGAS